MCYTMNENQDLKEVIMMKYKLKQLLLCLISSTFGALLVIEYLDASKKIGLDGLSGANNYELSVLIFLVIELIIFFIMKEEN